MEERRVQTIVEGDVDDGGWDWLMLEVVGFAVVFVGVARFE